MKATHIPEEDYPTFDDFDRNGDGTVTFRVNGPTSRTKAS